MRLEFHQLDRRWEHLRVRPPARQRQLLASLAEAGQQTPIVVVAVAGQANIHRRERHGTRAGKLDAALERGGDGSGSCENGRLPRSGKVAGVTRGPGGCSFCWPERLHTWWMA